MLLALLLSLQGDEIAEALEKIRAGETPKNLASLRNPRILNAISEEIRARRPCTEEVALHLCAHGERAHAEALLELLGHRTVKVAYAAVFALAPLSDEKLLALLEPKLDGAREIQLRTLTLLAESRMAAAAPLLEKRVALLDPADSDRARAFLRAAGDCRVRKAHDAVMAYYEKTDDEQAIRALGRLWETKLDAPPLERSEEILRLSSLVVIRRLALGGATKPLYCEAMLRVLTSQELDKFLRDFAGESFFARRVMATAAMSRSFDRGKGTRLGEAFLANPDAGVVALVLIRSSWDLPQEKLASLLVREDEAKIEDAPAHARVCDLAVWRLALQVDRKENEIPPELEKREALVRDWQARMKK